MERLLAEAAKVERNFATLNGGLRRAAGLQVLALPVDWTWEVAMKTKSLLHGFHCAFTGLWDTIRSERNAKIHVVAAISAIAAGVCLNLSRTEWAILTLTIGAVFAAELANSAVEHVVNLVSPEYHDLARRAKDAAAASVLVTAIAALVIGLLLFRVIP